MAERGLKWIVHALRWYTLWSACQRKWKFLCVLTELHNGREANMNETL